MSAHTARPTRVRLFILTTLLILLCVVPIARAQDIRATNTARYVGSGQYDWTMFLVADPPTFGRVAYVEYTLHPSLPKPVRRVTSARGGFELKGTGQGEFNVPIKVVLKDGRTLNLEHWLKLQDRSVRLATAVARTPRVLRTGNVSHYVGNGRWEWEVYVAADPATLHDIRCVEYTLHPTFPDPVRSVCTGGSDASRAFALKSNGWGTFTIGVKVSFRDGAVQYLQHELTFVPGR